MASRLVVERVALKTLQKYHHSVFNTFGEHETLIEAISSRPGFFGANPVAYISIFARRPSIQYEDLEEALLNDASLIRVPAFRASLYILCTQDYPTFFRALHHQLYEKGIKELERSGISSSHLSLFKRILERENSKKTLNIIDIANVIASTRTSRPSLELVYKVARKLCDMGVLVRAHSKGWKGNEFNYALLKNWAPDISLRPDNPETARVETIRKYLRAYGPASMEDISWWTGLPLVQCQRTIGNLRREAVRFHIEGIKEDMIGLKESIELFRKRPMIEEEIQLLPPWDPYTSAWKCKKRIAEKNHLPYIFDQHGNAASVIIDNGKVIGLWQFRDTEVNVLEFFLFPQYIAKRGAVIDKLESWATAITKLSGAYLANIIERPLGEALDKREAGAFLWPLGKMSQRKAKYERQEAISPMERRTSNTFRNPYLDNNFLIRANAVSKDQELDSGSGSGNNIH